MLRKEPENIQKPAIGRGRLSLVPGALASAKTDGAAFLKAESALRAPSQAPAGGDKSSTPIVWLPIDSRIDVGDEFQPTAEKTAAVINAKKHPMKGEGDQALQTVKSSALDIDHGG